MHGGTELIQRCMPAGTQLLQRCMPARAQLIQRCMPARAQLIQRCMPAGSQLIQLGSHLAHKTSTMLSKCSINILSGKTLIQHLGNKPNRHMTS